MARSTNQSARLLCGIAAFCAAAPAFAADADDDSAEPAITVYGRNDGYQVGSSSSPTKTDTKLIDVPQAVSVINRMQLDDQGVESLNDALRYVPGVTLGLGEGHRDQITLRGQSSTADFFLDGIRDDAQYYRPLYNVERVEVLKGANALIFGRGGGGGVINRVSKAPDYADTFGSASGAVDSFGGWSLAGDANTPLSDAAALRLAGTYEDFANHRDFYDGHFIGFAPTLGLKLGEMTKLVIAYEFAEDRRLTDRGVPSVAGAPITGQDSTLFGDPKANRSEVTAHIARARIDHEFSSDWSANLTAQYAHYDKFYANVYPRGATAATVELEGYSNGTKRENAIVQGNLVGHIDTGPLKHTLLLGFEAGWQATDNIRSEAQFGSTLAARATVAITRPLVLPAITFSAPSRSSTSDTRTLSGYVQDQIEIGEHVQVIAGLRYDDFRISSLNRINLFAASRSDGKWSPRLGLVIKPQENLSIYASYARSFLPQSGDQFTVLDATTATLAPEEFRNLEAGIKWDLTPELGVTAAIFRLDRFNTRATEPITGNPVQTGRSRSEGFEIALNGRITHNWQASLGYAHQNGEIMAATAAAPAGRRLAQLPEHQLTAWTRYDVTGELGLGLGLVHQSSQFSTISNAVRLPGFTRLDAAVYYDVSDKISLQLNVENLTDADYFPSAHTDFNIATGKPLNAKLTARIKF